MTAGTRWGFSTRMIHVGEEVNLNSTGGVTVPIHLSSTYARARMEEATTGYSYARNGTPTRDALEARLASSENAQFGFAFSSGIAAATNILLTLKSGAHIVALEDLYGNTTRLFEQVFRNLGYSFTYVDGTRHAEIAGAISPHTQLIWLETPTNPLLRLVDLPRIVKLAKKTKIKTVVDNTFATPYLQNPLKLGIDIVMHSTTKYIGGHSDLLGGAVMTNDKKLAERLRLMQKAVGAVPSSFDCYLAMRGFKTLGVRMEKHCANAMELATFLQRHAKIDRVYYPGISDHPQHALAQKQMRGFGGMVSFEVKGGYKAAKRLLESLRIIVLAVSLGGVESLAEHPYSMSHQAVSDEMKLKAGITPSLVRLSVGIEDVTDLISDLKQGLSNV